jgi:hypothetical protein
MLAPKAPPPSIDCMTCGANMELTAVEPRAHRTLYTYRCPSRHLQELAIVARLHRSGWALYSRSVYGVARS